jgi:hypothetical protein
MGVVTKDFGDSDDDFDISDSELPDFLGKANDNTPEPPVEKVEPEADFIDMTEEAAEPEAAIEGEMLPASVVQLHAHREREASPLSKGVTVQEGDFIDLDDSTVNPKDTARFTMQRVLEDALYSSIMQQSNFAPAAAAVAQSPLMPEPRQRPAQQSVSPLYDTVRDVVGGALAGSVGQALGAATNLFRRKPPTAAPAGAAVQHCEAFFDHCARHYGDCEQQMWRLNELSAVNKKIEQIAEKTGTSVESVRADLRSKPEHAGLLKELNAAIKGSPVASSLLQNMAKIQDDWLDNFTAYKKKEMTSDDHEERKAFSDVFKKKTQAMMEAAKKNPFDCENGESQFQRFGSRLKEALKGLVQLFNKLTGKDHDSSSEPSPP